MTWGWWIALLALACIGTCVGQLTLAFGAVPFLLLLPSLPLCLFLSRKDPWQPVAAGFLNHGWLLLALAVSLVGPLDWLLSATERSRLSQQCAGVLALNATSEPFDPRLDFGRWLIGPFSMIRFGTSGKFAPEPTRRAVYKVHPRTGRRLEIDLWLPHGSACCSGKPCPALLYFHGGGWLGGQPREVAPGLVEELTARGVVVASAQYTLLGEASSSRLSVADAYADGRDALFWLRNHSAELCVNPSSVTLMGVSAGAWMATIVGYGHPYETAGVIASVGRHDLATGRTWTRGYQEQVCGSAVDEGASCWSELSPINHVGPRSPPTILLAGTADAIVPVDNSRRMQQALNMAAVRNCFVSLPGDGHSLSLIDGGVGNQLTVALAAAFVAGPRGAQSSPTVEYG